ncbi:MAG TPA: glycosyltransferase [Sphingomonadaceae bacterium]|nr:glycosyltransferase [Sphingomonadaceae bacterium]
MKIVHVVNRCVPGEYLGGVERVVLDLATAQAQSGADVTIAAYSSSPSADRVIEERLRIRYFGGRTLLGVVSSPPMFAALGAEAPPFDVLHAHATFHPLNWEAARLAAARGRSIFFHAHGALDPRLIRGASLRTLKKKAYIALVERRNLNGANAVFALSTQEEQQLREMGVSAPIEIVPNGVAPPPVGTVAGGLRLRHTLGIDPTAPVVLYLGRIVAKKRIEAIIQALALLPSSGPAACLLIGGNEDEPDYARTLRALIEELGLRARVHWLGFLKEVDKPDVFAASNVFVHASESEGMAMSILEGMAAGLPTLVTPGCYMTEASAAGAVLETAGDPQAIRAGLAKLTEDAGLAARIGQHGRAYVAENHGWPALAKRVLAAYDQYSHNQADGHTSR